MAYGTLPGIPCVSMIGKYIFTSNKHGPLTSLSKKGIHSADRTPPLCEVPCLLWPPVAQHSGGMSLREVCLPSFGPGHAYWTVTFYFPLRLTTGFTMLQSLETCRSNRKKKNLQLPARAMETISAARVLNKGHAWLPKPS